MTVVSELTSLGAVHVMDEPPYPFCSHTMELVPVHAGGDTEDPQLQAPNPEVPLKVPAVACAMPPLGPDAIVSVTVLPAVKSIASAVTRSVASVGVWPMMDVAAKRSRVVPL